MSELSRNPVLRLDGPLERASFPPLLSAILGLIAAFLLFQGISTVVLVGATLTSGTPLGDLMSQEGLTDFLAENADLVIWANTIGQIFGLLIPGLILARLHSRQVLAFIRWRPARPGHMVWAAVGLIGLIPLVHFSAGLFDSLPWPQWVRDIEDSQMALIEQILTQDFSLLFAISMLALTPAICEEVLFRGYIQRQAERSLGAWGGILFSGIIFGFYHLRLTQAVPRSLLGIFMAWLTWQTRSLWPAMFVHLINNSFAAVLGKMTGEEVSDASLDAFEFPWWALALSVVILAGSIMALKRIPPIEEDRGEPGIDDAHSQTEEAT